jgi:hypothetical protein
MLRPRQQSKTDSTSICARCRQLGSGLGVYWNDARVEPGESRGRFDQEIGHCTRGNWKQVGSIEPGKKKQPVGDSAKPMKLWPCLTEVTWVGQSFLVDPSVEQLCKS